MYQANLCASSFLAKIIASSVINSLARDFVSLQFMFRLLRLIPGPTRRLRRCRRGPLFNYHVLRQQLLFLKGRHLRPRVPAIDKVFRVLTRRIWPGWMPSLILVSTETIDRWHRAAFQTIFR